MANQYFMLNPDVAAAYEQSGRGVTPEQFAQTHYSQFGQSEGRAAPTTTYGTQGITGSQISNFITNNLSNPQTIFDAAQQFGITANDIYSATGYTPQRQESFFGGAGLASLPVSTSTPYVDIVQNAYANIGRTGIGEAPQQIDQGGLNYWVNQLQSGAITPENFQETFNQAAVGYAAANPESDITKYVADYLAETKSPEVFGKEMPSYLLDNPDVMSAYIRGNLGSSPEQFAISHYLKYGQGEGRQAPAEVPQYFVQNPDVATAYIQSGSQLTPEQFAQAHYSQYGRTEGRAAPSVVSGTEDLTPLELISYITSNLASPTDIYQQSQRFGVDANSILNAYESFGSSPYTLEQIQNYLNTGKTNYEKQFSSLINEVFGSEEDQKFVKDSIFNQWKNSIAESARRQYPNASQEQIAQLVDQYVSKSGETPDSIAAQALGPSKYVTQDFDDIKTLLTESGANRYQEANRLAGISQNILGYDDEQALALYTKALAGGLSENEKAIYDELLATGTISNKTQNDLLMYAAATNPNAPIFTKNPELLELYTPLPGIVTKTSDTKWGGGSGQYGYYDGAPVLNADVARSIVGEHGQTTNLNYGRNYSDIAKTLGMDFASHAETTMWKAGNSIVGVDFDKKYIDDLANLERGLKDGTIVESRDSETNQTYYSKKVPNPNYGQYVGGEDGFDRREYIYQLVDGPVLPESSRVSGYSVAPSSIKEAEQKLQTAAEKLGISTKGKDIYQLFDEVTASTTGLYQVTGNSSAIDREKYPDAKNHVQAIYRQAGNKLVPVDVNFFHADAPKKKKFGPIGGFVGDMLSGIASIPLVAEIAVVASGGTLAPYYPAIKAVQVGGLTGDLEEGLKAGAKAWVIQQGATMANQAIGDYLIDQGFTDISTVNALSNAGANIAANMGIAALDGESLGDAGIAALVASAISTGARGATKGLNIPAQYQPVVAQILTDAILKKDLEKTLTNIAIKTTGKGIVDLAKQTAKEAKKEKAPA